MFPQPVSALLLMYQCAPVHSGGLPDLQDTVSAVFLPGRSLAVSIPQKERNALICKRSLFFLPRDFRTFPGLWSTIHIALQIAGKNKKGSVSHACKRMLPQNIHTKNLLPILWTKALGRVHSDLCRKMVLLVVEQSLEIHFYAVVWLHDCLKTLACLF